MAIGVQCECGRKLKLSEDKAGRKVRCPDCQSILTVPVATSRRKAASTASTGTPLDDDLGDINFDELAELERSSRVASEEFRVHCPGCGSVFVAVASSGNSKVACKGCSASFRINDHIASLYDIIGGSSRSARDNCTQCGRPIPAGDGICDACGKKMAGKVAAKHEGEDREHRAAVRQGLLEKLGVNKVGRFFGNLLRYILGSRG